MINPAELRIGNWVKSNDLWLTVSGISKASFTATHQGKIYFNMEDIQPIPLTEEWLMRFGFIFHKEFIYYDSSKQDLWISKPFSIAKGYQNRFTLMRQTPGTSSRWDFMNIVDCVHSLQNLIFALTGEELTIKEL